MSYFGAPIMGSDELGNPIMMTINESGETTATSNTVAQNASSEWQSVEIKQLFKTSAGVLGFGTGVDAGGSTVNLAWNNPTGTCTIGAAASMPTNVLSGEYYNSDWIIATGSAIVASDYNFNSSSPAGGYDTTPADSTVLASVPVNSLTVKGSVAVGVSSNTIGSWPSSASWTHQYGTGVNSPTGVLKTLYTFPGYTGANAQVQYANTIVSGNSTASYGLMGNPQMTVSWAA